MKNTDRSGSINCIPVLDKAVSGNHVITAHTVPLCYDFADL